MEEAFKLIHCKFNITDIMQYDPFKRFNSKAEHKDYSYIKTVFSYGMISEVNDGSLVWRASDFR